MSQTPETHHLVALMAGGEMRKPLAAGDDMSYAKWSLQRLIERGEASPADTIARVTHAEFERLCVGSRYRHACQQASKQIGGAA